MYKVNETYLWPNTEKFLSTKLLMNISTDNDAWYSVNEKHLDCLKDSKYYGLAVPEEYKGLGATFTQICATQMRLAATNFGLAIGLNMHHFTVGIIKEHFDRNKDISWALLEAVSSQDRMIASAFAEPKLGGSLLRSNIKAKKVEGGYLITGIKTPCSFAKRSDLICLQFEYVDSENVGKLLVALIPADSKGIEVKETWSAMGMKSSESDTICFNETFVPEKLVFHTARPGYDDDNTFSAGIVWFSLLTSASYIGGAKKALQQCASELQESLLVSGNRRADLPTLQAELGKLNAALLGLESSCYGVAAAYERNPDPEACLEYAMAIKHESVDTCLKIVSGAMELVGGRSYGENSILSRLARDMQAILFHPPTRFVSRLGLGRSLLGLAKNFDLRDFNEQDILEN